MDHSAIKRALNAHQKHVVRHYDEILENWTLWTGDPNIVSVDIAVRQGCWRCYSTIKRLHAIGLYQLQSSDNRSSRY